MLIDPFVQEPPALNETEVATETLHFDYPGSDIVLRSCDSHDFHVLKLYIVNSSPVLRGLIRSVSNPPDVLNGDEQEPLQVVKLPESGATLYSLLTLIFPVIPILPSASENIMELLGVAQKYQMDSVSTHIRGIIARQDPPFIRPETAFHIYFLAQQHGLHQEAVQAARVTLRLPMTVEELGDKFEFHGMTGAYLHALWKYHERVRTDLKSSLLEFKNSGLPKEMKGLRCKKHPPLTNYLIGPDGISIEWYLDSYTFPLWLDDYISSIADTPHLFDIISFENARARHFQNKTYSSCSCVYMSSQVIRTFWEALTAVVYRTMEKPDTTLALVKEEPTPENSDLAFVPLCFKVPDANIILRSSDQVNFRVHKSLLAMSSPFFEDLFSLPQPPDDELVDGLPVVQLPEDADLLNSLVSLLYPIPDVIPGSYEKVFALLASCQKYDMESIQSHIRAEMQRGTIPVPVEAEAFSAYAQASSMGLIPEMENAARLTLGLPMTFESLGEALRQFKGPALYELVSYRVANTKVHDVDADEKGEHITWNGYSGR